MIIYGTDDKLALPYKCKHRDAGIQKAFPNVAFGLPNGRKWAPKETGFPPEECRRYSARALFYFYAH